MKNIVCLMFIMFSICTCRSNEKGTFGYDIDFLSKHKKTIVLKNNNDKCQIAIVPDYQGRVMTSTSDGLNGKSYGWINYELISSNKFEKHINVFGGEDRFWLGPEGGQYSIFFKEGDDFNIDNWYTPKAIDTEPFSLVSHTDNRAVFNKQFGLTNYQGFEFEIEVLREISILDKASIEKSLLIEIGDQVSYVGFESKNKITNIGPLSWTKENGLLSMWILGMFNPTSSTTVIIPYKDSLELNTRYFGEIDSDRLRISEKNILFKGDGKYRSKIGVPSKNALSVLGSYDAENKVLTIVQFSLSKENLYVNSLWEYQEKPYEGDVVNTYNDGPLDNGDQLGPFYELESSSAAKELNQNEFIKHTHKTFHFEGELEDLNGIAEKILNTDLSKIQIF